MRICFHGLPTDGPCPLPAIDPPIVSQIGRNSTHVHMACSRCGDVQVYRLPKTEGGYFTEIWPAKKY